MTEQPEQPLNGLEVEPDPVYWRGFRDGREVQAAAPERIADDLAGPIYYALMEQPGFRVPRYISAGAFAKAVATAVAVRYAALATPPPVPAAPCVIVDGDCILPLCPNHEAVLAASLDVERLARWLHEKVHNLSPDTFADDQCDCRAMAAEYARLTDLNTDY